MPSNKRLNGCRVLIVEDEYFLADDLEKALTARGAIIVGPISEFDEAYDQVVRDGFDVAVIDLNLRGEKSYEIADELTRQGVPFIFCSGYDREVIPDRFGKTRLCQKPIDASEIIGEIVRLGWV